MKDYKQCYSSYTLYQSETFIAHQFTLLNCIGTAKTCVVHLEKVRKLG